MGNMTINSESADDITCRKRRERPKSVKAQPRQDIDQLRTIEDLHAERGKERR